MVKSIAIQMIVFSSVVLAVGGCQQQAAVNHSEEFAPEEKPTSFSRLMNAQAARGAANDATLYTCHFDGADVNSLGKAKLDLMLASANQPLAIWMATPDDQDSAARQQSVQAYLKQKGLPADQVVFGRGANPATDHPAAEGLNGLSKTESVGSTTSGSPGGTGAPPAGTP